MLRFDKKLIIVRVGEIWIFKHKSLSKFDKDKTHPKLIVDKEDTICYVVPGTSKSKNKKNAIAVLGKDFIKKEFTNLNKQKTTYFLCNFKRPVNENYIKTKGECIGWIPKERLGEVYECSKRNK